MILIESQIVWKPFVVPFSTFTSIPQKKSIYTKTVTLEKQETYCVLHLNQFLSFEQYYTVTENAISLYSLLLLIADEDGKNIR